MIDAPERQDQYPALVDLEESGGWLIFGAGGAGKTTLLRTIAVSAAAAGSADEVAMLGFDFASRGLGAVNALGQVVDVATGDDLEAVTRHIAVLGDELVRRRRLLADAHSEHLTAYNERHEPLPRILVLIDGFGGFMSTFGDGARGSGMSSAVPLESWIDRLVTIIVDGRQVGIHTVITADRRNAVPARIHAAIGSRLIMRHSDETGYNEHGISSMRAKTLDLSPGRGLWDGGATVQIAAVARDPSARGQGDAIADFAALLGTGRPSVLASAALPDELPVSRIQGAVDAPLHVPIGVADISGAAVVVDLSWSNLTITGPPRSGRSTALNTAAAVLAASHEVWAVGPASSPLDLALVHDGAVGRADDLAPILERLANLYVLGSGKRPRVLLVDDLDRLDDPTLNPIWAQLADHDDFRLIASIESRSMTGYTSSEVLNLARRSRRLLVLRPDDASDFLQMTGIKPPIRPGVAMPPGRGVLVADRQPTVIQVARTAAVDTGG
jgi:S-DNA-T family DNA segregation ATPase FtsK/SpoIIIE